MALAFSDLYGSAGLGLWIGDTATASATDRKRITNDGYVELAQIKGPWRLRVDTSTLAMVAGTYQYNLPADFDGVFRVYYREAGKVMDIEVVPDSLWLIKSATRSADAGTPQFARITQTSATQNQIELDVPPSAAFVSAYSTLTLEYWIEITRLSDDADEPVLPANLRHYIVPVAALKFATVQGDTTLIASLTRPQGARKPSLVEEAFMEIRRHDLTRTGRPRQLRPSTAYLPSGGSRVRDYGGIHG